MAGGAGGAHEVVIDGKLMNIGRSAPGGARINLGADLGPGDPGSEFSDQRGQSVGGSNPRGDHSATLNASRRDSYEIPSLETVQPEQGTFTPCDNADSKKSDRLNRWNVKHMAKIVLIIALVTAYNGYLAYALHYHIKTGRELDWCGGLGFLIILSLVTYTSLLYFHVLKRLIPGRKVRLLVPTKLITFVHTTKGRWLLNTFVLAAISTFLIIDTKNDRQRLISAAGVFVIIFLGGLFSTSRRDIVWRHVAWGLSLQFLFGLLILRWKFGKMFFNCIGDKVCQDPNKKSRYDVVSQHYSG